MISKCVHLLSRILLQLIGMVLLPLQDVKNKMNKISKKFKILGKWVPKTKIKRIRFNQNNFGISEKQLIHSKV